MGCSLHEVVHWVLPPSISFQTSLFKHLKLSLTLENSVCYCYSFIVGITPLNCLPKNLCAGDISVDFDSVLVNSSMARQGLVFSLLNFLMIYFICFTADSVPLKFDISGELGFHLDPYLWASSHDLVIKSRASILWDDWPIFMISGSNEQLQQPLEYTLLKPDCHSWWISKMQSGREDTWEERHAIKFCFKLGKNDATETYGMLQTALAWIEHEFLSGIRDSRKARSLWGMMRGVGGVRKSVHHSW